MSDSYQKAQSLLSSSISKVKSRVSADGTKVGQSRYGGNNTGTIYGANVDTKGNEPPQLKQVDTKTRKSINSNMFAN